MQESSRKREALINEQKGFLFEFLVAKKIAKNTRCGQEDFLKKLDISLWERLQRYEREIVAIDLLLHRSLQKFSDAVAKKILDKFKDVVIEEVRLVSRNSLEDRSADLLIITNLETKKISLKLCKDASFVNTKSGGIKSFLTTYFKSPISESEQEHLNQALDQHYQRLRFSLLEQYGLDVLSEKFSEWVEQALPVLPGELAADPHQVVLRYYADCLQSIFDSLERIRQSSNGDKVWCAGLLSLCGFVDKLDHVFCLHRGTKSYELSRVIYLPYEEAEQEVPHVESNRRDLSYFLINYPSKVLQIRVKPMRDFTAKSMKVNCSVRVHE